MLLSFLVVDEMIISNGKDDMMDASMMWPPQLVRRLLLIITRRMTEYPLSVVGIRLFLVTNGIHMKRHIRQKAAWFFPVYFILNALYLYVVVYCFALFNM